MAAPTVSEVCNIRYWGINYYDTDEQGGVIVRPNPAEPQKTVSLHKLVAAVQKQHDARLPILFCFRRFWRIV